MIEDVKTYNGHTYSAGVQYQACMDGYVQGRADAIDDFARNIMNALSDDMDMEYICKDIVFLVSKVAEQLKEKKDEY